MIDLEKTRPLLFGERDRVKDLEPLLRRASAWGDDDVACFLTAYLGDARQLGYWLQRLTARFKDKARRS